MSINDFEEDEEIERFREYNSAIVRTNLSFGNSQTTIVVIFTMVADRHHVIYPVHPCISLVMFYVANSLSSYSARYYRTIRNRLFVESL